MAKKEEVYYNEHGERVYPNQKKKRPFLFGCLGLIVLIIIIAGCTMAVSGGDSDTGSDDSSEKQEKGISGDKRAALNSAKTYADTMHMSEQAIYEQLKSKDGDQFSEEDAQYAVDHLDVDYKENALKSAETYQEDMDMSKQGIYDQLTSEYGDQFTDEQAQYAVDNLK